MGFYILVIGAGRIGRVHAASIVATRKLRLFGFVDPSLDVVEGFEDFPVFETPEEAMADARPDGIVIASPTETHLGYLNFAAENGLPTFCEKPVAASLKDTKAALNLTNETGLPVLLGFHRRFDPHRCEVKRRIDAGEIGRIQHILLMSRDPWLPDVSTLEHQGGIVSDMLIHDLDELLWLVGSIPNEISGYLDRLINPALASLPDHDTAALQFHWADGKSAHLSATREATHAFEQRLEVLGTGGRLVCDDPQTSAVRIEAANDTRLPRRHRHFWDRYQAAYLAEMAEFREVIAGTVTPRCTLEDGLRAY